MNATGARKREGGKFSEVRWPDSGKAYLPPRNLKSQLPHQTFASRKSRTPFVSRLLISASLLEIISQRLIFSSVRLLATDAASEVYSKKGSLPGEEHAPFFKQLVSTSFTGDFRYVSSLLPHNHGARSCCKPLERRAYRQCCSATAAAIN
jgi:hypothetical protein